MGKLQLIRQYVDLLKITFVAFFLSTTLHTGTIVGYYWLYLYFNPDDQGKKDFYEATTVTQGVNIGGKILGGGGIQTNHHKSYMFHLVREYYKSLSKTFFIEFSLVYVFFLYLLNFFPNRERLRKSTATVFDTFKATNKNKYRKKLAMSINSHTNITKEEAEEAEKNVSNSENSEINDKEIDEVSELNDD